MQTLLLVNVISVPCYEHKSISLLPFERLYRTLILPMPLILIYNGCRSFSIGHVRSSVRVAGQSSRRAVQRRKRKQQNLNPQRKISRCWSCTKHRWDYVSSSSRMLGSWKTRSCGRNSRHQSEQRVCASFLSIPRPGLPKFRESPWWYENVTGADVVSAASSSRLFIGSLPPQLPLKT